MGNAALLTDRDGIVYNLAEATYRVGPELSSTGAKKILDSPARFRWEQDHPTPSTPAMNLGTLVHNLVLDQPIFVQFAVTDEHTEFRTNAAKAWKAAQEAAGLIPITRAKYEEAVADAMGMADAVLAHPLARTLMEQDGDTEVSVFGTDPETGVRCRGRFDFLPTLTGWAPIAVDVKTTAGSASARGFGKTAADYNYPVQQEHYLDLLAWVTDLRLPMRFVVVEKAPPYLVAVHELPADATRIGADLAAGARRIFRDCTEADVWPGHPETLTTAALPGWWYAQEVPA